MNTAATRCIGLDCYAVQSLLTVVNLEHSVQLSGARGVVLIWCLFFSPNADDPYLTIKA